MSMHSIPHQKELVKKLIYISMILIFIAHATIHDAQTQAKVADKEMTLQETLIFAFK